MNKRIISGLAAIVLTFSGAGTALANIADLHFDVAASAAEIVDSGTCGEDMTWTFDDEGTLTVSGKGEMNDYDDDENAPWQSYRDDIKKIVITGEVTHIGDRAFKDCQNFKYLYVKNSIESIGVSAFENCTRLQSGISFSRAVSIGDYAFKNCANILGFYIASTVTCIGVGVFSGCTSLKTVEFTYPSVTSIGEYAFDGCTALSYIKIPNSVVSIGDYAFRNCERMGAVTFGESRYSDFPSSITSIGKYAFDHCTRLKNINQYNLSYCLPDTITSIGEGAFRDCTNLLEIGISNNLKNIEYGTFENCTSLRSVLIGKNCTSIGSCAFSNCESLKELRCIIEYYNDKYHTKRISTKVGKNVTSIGDHAFANCKSLQSVTIPRIVTEIGEEAFAHTADNFKIFCCKRSTGEQYAVDHGFEYEFVIDENPVITATPGYGCMILKWEPIEDAERYIVSVSDEETTSNVEMTTDPYYELYGLKAGKKYSVAILTKFNGNWYSDTSNAITITPNYPVVSDINYNKESGRLNLNWEAVEGAEEYGIAVRIAGKWKVQSYTDKTFYTSPKLTPGSTYEMVICAKVNGRWDTTYMNDRTFKVTTVEEEPVAEETILQRGTCGDHLTWTLDKEGTLTVSGVGDMTNYNNTSSPWSSYIKDIKKIVIRHGVTSIGAGAFANAKCSSVTIPDSVNRIGNSAFYYSDLLSVEIPGSVKKIGNSAFKYCNRLKSLTLSDGIETIGTWAFSYCGRLKSVTIPDSVTSLGSWVFEYCSELTDVTFSKNIARLEYGTFSRCDCLENITVPDGVEKIDEYAFENCVNLKSITIPSSVKSIGVCAFRRCISLENIVFGDGIKNIDYSAFTDCTKLKSVTVPKSVADIGEYALGYYYSEKLKKMVKTDNFKISCFKNSAGEKYAKDNKFEYELIGTNTANPLFTVSHDDGSVILNWEAVETAENYAVAVYDDGKWTLVEKITDTSYTLYGLKPGVSYRVAVAAMFDGEWDTEFYNAVSVMSNHPAVTDIEYNEQTHQFRAIWNEIEGATEYAVAVKNGGNWEIQAYTNRNFYTSPKLTPGSTFEMVIYAKVNGKWEMSNPDDRAFEVTVK